MGPIVLLVRNWMGPNVQSGKNGMGSNVHGTNCLAPTNYTIPKLNVEKNLKYFEIINSYEQRGTRLKKIQ